MAMGTNTGYPTPNTKSDPVLLIFVRSQVCNNVIVIIHLFGVHSNTIFIVCNLCASFRTTSTSIHADIPTANLGSHRKKLTPFVHILSYNNLI